VSREPQSATDERIDRIDRLQAPLDVLRRDRVREPWGEKA
jgi:hypothetical protein